MNTDITLVVKAPYEEVEELTFSSVDEMLLEHGNLRCIWKRIMRGETWHILNDKMFSPYPGGTKVTIKQQG